MATRRTRSVSTKVTEQEYQQFAQLAGPQTISAWARSTLQKGVDTDPTPVAVVAELIAVRKIVLSLLFALARDSNPTEAMIYGFIDDADRNKLASACEHLAAATRASQAAKNPR